MWMKFITEQTENAKFNPPASDRKINSVQTSLGCKFPDELVSLLLESNGVLGEYELGLVWKIDQIEHDNLFFRNNEDFSELYMPFDHLLFFGDAGNGDQFAFPINKDGSISRNDIFVWDHESDARKWIASSLRNYLEGWLDGSIVL